MPRDPYIVKRCGEIELLLTEAAGWASTNYKLGAHFAAYATVVIIGVLEDCIGYLVAQRVAKSGDSEVENYVGKVVGERFRNPEYGSISGLLREFSEDYQKMFKSKFSHDGAEAVALESIVSNKNSLAHVGTAKL